MDTRINCATTKVVKRPKRQIHRSGHTDFKGKEIVRQADQSINGILFSRLTGYIYIYLDLQILLDKEALICPMGARHQQMLVPARFSHPTRNPSDLSLSHTKSLSLQNTTSYPPHPPPYLHLTILWEEEGSIEESIKESLNSHCTYQMLPLHATTIHYRPRAESGFAEKEDKRREHSATGGGGR